jgi:hypothetical protein
MGRSRRGSERTGVSSVRGRNRRRTSPFREPCRECQVGGQIESRTRQREEGRPAEKEGAGSSFTMSRLPNALQSRRSLRPVTILVVGTVGRITHGCGNRTASRRAVSKLAESIIAPAIHHPSTASSSSAPMHSSSAGKLMGSGRRNRRRPLRAPHQRPRPRDDSREMGGRRRGAERRFRVHRRASLTDRVRQAVAGQRAGLVSDSTVRPESDVEPLHARRARNATTRGAGG